MGESTVLREVDIRTSNGRINLKLHRFPGKEQTSGYVQLNRDRYGKRTETAWVSIDIAEDVARGLRDLAAFWCEATRGEVT